MWASTWERCAAPWRRALGKLEVLRLLPRAAAAAAGGCRCAAAAVTERACGWGPGACAAPRRRALGKLEVLRLLPRTAAAAAGGCGCAAAAVSGRGAGGLRWRGCCYDERGYDVAAAAATTSVASAAATLRPLCAGSRLGAWCLGGGAVSDGAAVDAAASWWAPSINGEGRAAGAALLCPPSRRAGARLRRWLARPLLPPARCARPWPPPWRGRRGTGASGDAKRTKRCVQLEASTRARDALCRRGRRERRIRSRELRVLQAASTSQRTSEATKHCRRGTGAREQGWLPCTAESAGWRPA
jgi:hypothetical protein